MNFPEIGYEQSLYHIVMQAPVGIVVFSGPDYIIELANDRYIPTTGKTRTEIIGKPAFEAIPIAANQGYIEILDNIRATGKPFELLEHKSPVERAGRIETIWLNIVYQPLKEWDGTVNKIMILVTDVTAQVETRKKLEAHQQELNELANAMPQVVWMASANGNVFYYNDRVAQFSGATLGPDGTWNWQAVLHPHDRQPTIDAWHKAVAESTPYEMEHRVQMKDGTYRWHLSRAFPKKDAAGAVLKWHGTATDIDDVKAAEEKIAEKEEQLRIAVAGGELGLFDFYPQSGKLSWSERTKVLFGLPQGAPVSNEAYFKAVHPDDRERSKEKVEQALQWPGSVYENEYRVVGIADGKQRWVRAKGKTSFDDEGNAIRFTGVLQDITQQKEAEQALAYRTALLEAHNQASSDGILLVDAQGKILSCNQRFAEIWSLPPDTITAEDEEAALAFATTQLAQPEQFMEKVKYLYEHPSETSIDTLVLKNGKIIERHGYAVRGEDSQYYAWSWTFRDITEQKNAERTIKESEERFRVIANEAPAFIFIAGENATVEFYNKTWIDFTGWDATVDTGRAWTAITHPDDIAAVNDAYIDGFNARKPYTVEARHKDAGGQYHWILWKGVPRFLANGQFIGMMGIGMDINERKQAENELSRVKEQLEIILRHVPSAIYLFDKNGTLLFANDKAAGLMGYTTAAEMKAEKDHALLRKRAEATLQMLDEAGQPVASADLPGSITMRTGKPAAAVVQTINKQTGASIWVLSKAEPMFDKAGQINFVLLSSTDISFQKASEKAIRESEMAFRQLADLVPQIIWTSRPDGFLDYYNKRWYDYTGFAEGYGDQSWLPILHPDDVQLCLDTWYQSVHTGEPYQIEYRFKDTETGAYRWFLGKAIPIKDKNGNITKWFGTCTDIHEQKTFSEILSQQVMQQTAQLQEANQELKHYNEELEQFAYVASHDLKEPVRKILTYISFIENRLAVETDIGAYIGKINTSAQRMSNLITDLLDYSRIESGAEKALVDLHEIVQEVMVDLELVIQQKGATVQLSNLPAITAIPVQMSQLFYNLLHNALKFSKPETAPQIDISCSVVSDYALLQQHGLPAGTAYYQIDISDNGIGFLQEHAEKIFTIFQRLHTKSKYEGTGIGLALCRKIAHKHGGTLVALSQLGKGTTMRLFVPKNT